MWANTVYLSTETPPYINWPDKPIKKWKAASDTLCSKSPMVILGISRQHKKEWTDTCTEYHSGYDTTASSTHSFPLRTNGRLWRYGLLCMIWRLSGSAGGNRISWLGVSVAVWHGLLDDRLQAFRLGFVAVDHWWDVCSTAWRWARRGSFEGMCTAATSGCLDGCSSRSSVGIRGRMQCRNGNCLHCQHKTLSWLGQTEMSTNSWTHGTSLHDGYKTN